MRQVLFGILVVMNMAGSAHAEPVKLFAAGSLKAAMSEVARSFEGAASEGRKAGAKVAVEFGPSGLLRKRIETEGGADIFASANMKHPETLADAGMAMGPVRMFARNQLCAIAQQGLGVTTDTLLAKLLDDDIRVGTSTPKADPSGDYAFALFGKAEALAPGAKAKLEAKALQLTGGADTAPAPKGQNQYGWVMASKRADIFLTYCTNAVLAKKEVPSLEIVHVPEALAVGADYGLIVFKDAPAMAEQLAAYILSKKGQAILQRYGFRSPE